MLVVSIGTPSVLVVDSFHFSALRGSLNVSYPGGAYYLNGTPACVEAEVRRPQCLPRFFLNRFGPNQFRPAWGIFAGHHSYVEQ